MHYTGQVWWEGCTGGVCPYWVWQNKNHHYRRSEEAQEDNSWRFPLSLSLLWLLCQSNSDTEEPHQQTPFTFVKYWAKIKSRNVASLFVALKASTTTSINVAHQGLIKMPFHNLTFHGMQHVKTIKQVVFFVETDCWSVSNKILICKHFKLEYTLHKAGYLTSK